MNGRYIWVVERGWVAESYWRRKLHFRLGSSLDTLPSGVIAGDDEIDAEGLAVVGINTDRSAWEIPHGGMGQTLVEAVLTLIAAKQTIAAMPSEPPFDEVRQFLKEWLSQQEDMLSRKLRGQLSFEEEHRYWQNLRAAFAQVVAGHPREKWPHLHYFKALVDWMLGAVGSRSGARLRYMSPSPATKIEVPRPFSRALTAVSSLAELRAVLPPFTDGIEHSEHLSFEEERKRLAEVRNALLKGEKPLLHLFNAANEELGNAYDRYTTQMRWGIWAVTPAVYSDPVAFLQSYHEWYDEGDPIPWQRELAAEKAVRYKVVFGLFGLAYQDLMAEFDLARSRCPECRGLMTLGPRQHRDRLCEDCRRERKRASDRAYQAKKKTPQRASPGSRA